MNSKFLAIAAASLCTFTGPAQGVWNTNFPFMAPRALGAAATLGGKVLAVGGGDWTCGTTAALQAYDPVLNTWSTLAPMPMPRYELGAAELNGSLYAVAGNPGCGSASDAISALTVYDPLTDSWTTKAPLPAGTWSSGVVSANGMLYVIGGFTTSVYAYDPAANSWSARAQLPMPFSNGSAAVANGRIYVFGGDQGTQNIVQAYDPVADAWSLKAPMPTARSASAAAAVNGIIYVAGGYTPTGAVATVEAYNPATDSWTASTPLPFRLWGASATAVGETLYVTGGFDDNRATLGSVEALTTGTSIAGIAMYAGLTLVGTVGSTNHIQYSPDPSSTNWTFLTDVILPASPYLFVDTNSVSSPKRFYRVLQP